mmetsp:Transcript_2244/g.3255  ORF Transcript_2244/g.3255 Transcript_2244/m.3255 type:complete len:282 (-) Transcript_2244:272-1117(-)
MCHHSTSRDDTLCSPQILTQTPWSLAHVHQLGAGFRATHNVKPKHTTMNSISMVLVGEVFLWMGGQTWIHHLGHLGMLFQKRRNGHCIFTLFPHSQMHGLACLQDDVGRKRVDDVAMHILNPLHLLMHRLVLADHSTSSHDVVSLVVLGQALDHHISTPVQGTAHNGCCEGGIDHVLCTSILGNLGHSLDVSQGQDRIGRGLAEDQFGVGFHGLLDVFGISEVNEVKLHVQRRKELAAGPIGATIGAVRNDTMVACLHGGRDCAGGCSHACAKGTSSKPIL